jgi:hypothetical protein
VSRVQAWLSGLSLLLLAAAVLPLPAAAQALPAVAATQAEISPAGSVQVPPPIEVSIFRDALIQFAPDSVAAANGREQTDAQTGRVVTAQVRLPEMTGPHRVKALLTVKPIPKTEREVHDRWDRAGNIRLVAGEGEIEVVRFITSYGGRTEHEVDVTELAPLLRGERTFRAFIDTWMSPGWRIDLTLRYVALREYDNATWAAPLYYTDSFNAEGMPGGVAVRVEVPPGLARVVLRYFSTGHCTDGTDADEFISKANVISVDGVVVARFHPWRDDCRRFRERNPYTTRWTDGSWSSDYSRSGWCPGVEVLPEEFDLTDHLSPGGHVVGFHVEQMRPKDDQGHFGYWRVSAALVGWDRPPALWRNE